MATELEATFQLGWGDYFLHFGAVEPKKNLGRVVEAAPSEEVFARPNHPYTQALLAEVPRIENRKRHFAGVQGEIPSPLNPPGGCHFHPRCPYALARCKVERPVLREIAPGHRSACHLNEAT